MYTFGIALPPVYLVVAVIIFYFARRNKWGHLPLQLLSMVNFIAIWLLVWGVNPDYFFGCLAGAAGIGLLWMVFTVIWVYDLLIGRFFKQFSVLVAFASTFWWLGVLITNVG